MMKAVRYHGIKHVQCDEIPFPAEPKDDEVELKVECCGICGSDLSAYTAGSSMIPISKPNFYCKHPGPAEFGHEFAGTIIRQGKNVKSVAVGDRVAVIGNITCNECYGCKNGLINLCEQFGFYGYSGWSGGFSERAVIREMNVVKLPEGMDAEIGSLVEPLAVTWHAIKKGGVKQGDVVLIIGAGPIGLALLLCLKKFEPKMVIISEPTKLRNQQAIAFGATHVFNPHNEDIVKSVKSVSEDGVDVAFLCTGFQSAVSICCKRIEK
jgi:(R,R)-butanediol dehydrogenase/meso-butanediol dehydrogenase/diacetyl reductase